MNEKNINKKYGKFKIPDEKIPLYNNDPDKFIGQYKKCSIRTYGKITYSNSSEEYLKELEKEN